MSVYPWQLVQWRHLSQQLQRGRLPHAILCCGSQGLGKLAFARHLAAKVLCDASTDQACGDCRSCRLRLSGNHPDYYELHPLEKSSVIRIDQVRELIDKLHQTSHNKGFQVVLLEPAESMNQASSNALLKILEEPPGAVVFILVSHQITAIPATISSRCQLLNFNAPCSDKVLPWLMQQATIKEREKATLLLQLSEGAPLLALQMADQDYQALRLLILKHLWALLQAGETAMNVAEQLLKSNVNWVLEIIFSLCRDLLKIGLKFSDCSLQNQDCSKQLHKMHDKVNLSLLVEYLSQCLVIKHRLQNMPGLNAQLALEELFVRWQGLVCKK